MKHIELLAPAGSFESLHAAINAKCDAVYFGVDQFNMRARGAKNFSIQDIPELVQICHKKNIKAYLALNTIYYDQELTKIRSIIDTAKKNNIDAIIASDMAVIQYAKNKKIPVHISTQVSISNFEALKFYAKFADRAVLARELTLPQIRKIHTQIKKNKIKGPSGELFQLELFAHGALCVAVSGRCGMSLFCHNESANRGKCLQMCRRQYKVTDLETKREMIIDNNFVMSPSDLCTIGILPELIESGASVLKIEGRGRAADYVDVVVGTYKKALAAMKKGQYHKKNISIWKKELKTVFNRKHGIGLYRGKSFDSWSGTYGSNATKRKTLVGTIEKYYPKIKVTQINIKHKIDIKLNDKYIIIGPKTGIVRGQFKELFIDGKKSSNAKQGDVITFKTKNKTRVDDKLYLLSEVDSNSETFRTNR